VGSYVPKPIFCTRVVKPWVHLQAVVDGICVQQRQRGVTIRTGLLQPGEGLLLLVQADGDPRQGKWLDPRQGKWLNVAMLSSRMQLSEHLSELVSLT